MNTVFSVFKGSGGGGGGGISTTDAHAASAKSLTHSKSKLATTALKENSSYENLRHIRELESSINAFVVNAVDDGDDDDDTTSSSSGSQHTTIRMVGGGVGKRSVIPLAAAALVANGVDCGIKAVDASVAVSSADVVDFVVRSPVINGTMADGLMECGFASRCDSSFKFRENGVDAACSNLAAVVPSASYSSDGDISSSFKAATATSEPQQCERRFPDDQASKYGTTQNAVASSSGDLTHAPIIAANSRGHSESNLSAATKTTNRFQKRLSLSGFPNNSMPSVHGRPGTAATGTLSAAGGCASAGVGGEVKRTRLSTHQRNLSLDFR